MGTILLLGSTASTVGTILLITLIAAITALIVTTIITVPMGAWLESLLSDAGVKIGKMLFMRLVNKISKLDVKKIVLEIIKGKNAGIEIRLRPLIEYYKKNGNVEGYADALIEDKRKKEEAEERIEKTRRETEASKIRIKELEESIDKKRRENEASKIRIKELEESIDKKRWEEFEILKRKNEASRIRLKERREKEKARLAEASEEKPKLKYINGRRD